LDYDILANTTPILRTTDHQHPELGRYDVEAFGNILADAMQCTRAARANRALHIDHRFEPRQMGRQSATVGAALDSARLSLDWHLLLGRGMACRFDLLRVLESKLQLIHGQALSTSSEAVTLKLLDDLAQSIALGTLGKQHRLELFEIVREIFATLRHKAMES
jgi:hypothetical protein